MYPTYLHLPTYTYLPTYLPTLVLDARILHNRTNIQFWAEYQVVAFASSSCLFNLSSLVESMP